MTKPTSLRDYKDRKHEELASKLIILERTLLDGHINYNEYEIEYGKLKVKYAKIFKLGIEDYKRGV